LVREENLNKLL